LNKQNGAVIQILMVDYIMQQPSFVWWKVPCSITTLVSSRMYFITDSEVIL